MSLSIPTARFNFPKIFPCKLRVGAQSQEKFYDNYAFDVRAAPEELHCRFIDLRFADAEKSSASPFESSGNGAEVGSADSQVEQPNQAVHKRLNQQKEPCRVAHREFSFKDTRVHVLDVGSGGRVWY